MWLFHKLDCQSLVILSTSSFVYLGDTFTKVIKVLPFLDNFNKVSGSLPICRADISHYVLIKYVLSRFILYFKLFEQNKEL